MNEGRTIPIFNAFYDTYDDMQTNKRPAKRLVEIAKLAPGQQVLDVACGSGWATIPAAQAVGVTGRVIGIDIADKLIDLARQKTSSTQLSNVEYRLGNAESLEFGDARFDMVLCALSIFVLRDIPKALGEWHRVLKSGGKLAFSSFGVGLLQPTYDLFSKCLARYDGQVSKVEQPLMRTDTPDKCQELLGRTDFREIEIISEQLGFYLPDKNSYWKEMSSGNARLRLDRLSPDELEKFKAEHLAEVDSLRTESGIWINLPVIFSLAIKP
jgi:ubiquinone/menaquinone biosynthesis C-methylase UbiE